MTKKSLQGGALQGLWPPRTRDLAGGDVFQDASVTGCASPCHWELCELANELKWTFICFQHIDMTTSNGR
ncbi:MAG TPA: hypothetical protein VJZ49_09700, partial [Syntrophales bacterium]|nr:hypothetical protein [Syntrophales bacterium]